MSTTPNVGEVSDQTQLWGHHSMTFQSYPWYLQAMFYAVCFVMIASCITSTRNKGGNVNTKTGRLEREIQAQRDLQARIIAQSQANALAKKQGQLSQPLIDPEAPIRGGDDEYVEERKQSSPIRLPQFNPNINASSVGDQRSASYYNQSRAQSNIGGSQVGPALNQSEKEPKKKKGLGSFFKRKKSEKKSTGGNDYIYATEEPAQEVEQQMVEQVVATEVQNSNPYGAAEQQNNEVPNSDPYANTDNGYQNYDQNNYDQNQNYDQQNYDQNYDQNNQRNDSNPYGDHQQDNKGEGNDAYDQIAHQDSEYFNPYDTNNQK